MMVRAQTERGAGERWRGGTQFMYTLVPDYLRAWDSGADAVDEIAEKNKRHKYDSITKE